MNLELINSIACGLIVFWAAWCVLSGTVRDGTLGNLIYSAIAISGFVVMTRSQNIFLTPTTAGTTLLVFMALAGIRHNFMVTYWLRVKVGLRRTQSYRCRPECNKSGASNSDDQKPKPRYVCESANYL